MAIPTAATPRKGGIGDSVVATGEAAAAAANGAGIVGLITIDVAFSAYTKTSLETVDLKG